MQISLRTLLKFANKQYSPVVTAAIKRELTTKPNTLKVLERLYRVLNRKRLQSASEIPAQALPKGFSDNPNTISAYLDEKLTLEETATFEEICTEHDEYLGEVALCQKLVNLPQTVVNVTPTARQRMVHLVNGPEAQPLRIVPRENEANSSQKEEEKLLRRTHPDAQSQQVNLARWFPIALLLMVATITGLVVMLTMDLNTKKQKIEQPIAESDLRPKQEPAQIAKEPAARIESGGMWPFVAFDADKTHEGQLAAGAFGNIAGMLGNPTLPPNIVISSGLPEEKKPEEATTPPVVVENKKPQIELDLASKLPMGFLLGDSSGMMVREVSPTVFHLIKLKDVVLSNERIHSLPGFRNVVELANGIQLHLMGSLPSANTPCGEAMLQLHPAQFADVDLTLLRGRVIITSLPSQQSKIRVRYMEKIWELALQPNSEVAIQVYGRALPGDGDWDINHRLDMYRVAGEANVTKDQQTLTLGTMEQLAWSSRGEANGPGSIIAMNEAPMWLNKKPALTAEQRDGLSQLQRQIFSKTGEMAPEKLLRLALEESLEDRRPVTKTASLAGLISIDYLTPVLRTLDSDSAGLRKLAQEDMAVWLGHDASHAFQMQQAMVATGFSDSDAGLIMTLLRGYATVNRATVETLLQHLGHSQLCIRELAWQNLTMLLPDRPALFEPSGAQESRAKAIEQLRFKLLPAIKAPTPPVLGDVPPPP